MDCKNEVLPLPACDREWFVENGLSIMSALNVSITLDKANDQRVAELERDKELAAVISAKQQG